jgi:hypothetical protein
VPIGMDVIGGLPSGARLDQCSARRLGAEIKTNHKGFRHALFDRVRGGRRDAGGGLRPPAPFPSSVRRYGQPQHLARPSFDEIEGTPSTGLSVTSETPVLKKSRPGLG